MNPHADGRRAAWYYLRTYSLIAAAAAAGGAFPSPLAYLAAIWFIGARQHSLYVLNHEASHGSLFRSPKLNQAAATVLSNWPFFHHPEAYSFIQWRRIHRLHHAHLFTERDPNFMERRRRADAPGRVSRLLLECVLAGPRSLAAWFQRQDYAAAGAGECRKGRRHFELLLVPIAEDPEMEAERRAKLAALCAAATVIWAAGALWWVFWFWLVPMYTVYPAILRLMDLTEHRWTLESTDIALNTRSVRPGALGRWFVSDLGRSLHREHHLHPGVPFYRLEELSRRLIKEGALSAPERTFLAAGR